MSPLMQIIRDHLSACRLSRYIDPFERDMRSEEPDRLHRALSAALPESQRELLNEYAHLLSLRFQMDTEAMFQAAFTAARELGYVSASVFSAAVFFAAVVFLAAVLVVFAAAFFVEAAAAAFAAGFFAEAALAASAAVFLAAGFFSAGCSSTAAGSVSPSSFLAAKRG